MEQAYKKKTIKFETETPTNQSKNLSLKKIALKGSF